MKKKGFIVGLMLSFVCVNVYAIGFIGTPTAGLKQGQWGIGGAYGYSNQDLEKTESKGVDDGTPYTYNVKYEYKVNRYYGIFSYGLTEEWELFGKLGLADLKTESKDADDPTDDWDGVNWDNDFAWGLGTKYTFFKQDKFNWGASAQMNSTSTNYEENGIDINGPWKDKYDLDVWDLTIAVGPTIDMNGWKLYGGAFYYYLNGDLDVKGTYIDNLGDTLVWSESGDIRTDGHFGGFIGTQFDLTSNVSWTSEFSAKENAWGLGTSIIFKF